MNKLISNLQSSSSMGGAMSPILTAYLKSLIRLKMTIVAEATSAQNLICDILRPLMVGGQWLFLLRTTSSLTRDYSIYVCIPQPNFARYFLY